jgi:hypothetical protein
LVVLSLGAFPLALAASAASEPLHDGLYETAGVGPGYYSLELQVVGNGTRILGGLKGRFYRGTVIAKKTTAVTKTLSAPSICETATPVHFSTKWYGPVTGVVGQRATLLTRRRL